MKEASVELYERLEDIGNERRHEKRQQNIFEIPHQQDHNHESGYVQKKSDGAVESIWLAGIHLSKNSEGRYPRAFGASGCASICDAIFEKMSSTDPLPSTPWYFPARV